MNEIPRACEPLFGCPFCGWAGYFGPAVIIDLDEPNEYLYVTCKRCGENYLVTAESVAS